MVYFGKYNITKIYNSLFQHSVANGGGKDFLIDGGGGSPNGGGRHSVGGGKDPGGHYVRNMFVKKKRKNIKLFGLIFLIRILEIKEQFLKLSLIVKMTPPSLVPPPKRK